jgi:hypothetical protein
VSSWLERKLRLKVSANKTKVVRPNDSGFLGYTFWKSKDGWKPKPLEVRKAKLCEKVKEILCRREAAAVPLGYTFTKLNQLLRGWINYFRIGSMKTWLKNEFGPWLRHKVRVSILKQWKKPKTRYRNLRKLGVSVRHARMTAGSRQSYWAASDFPAVKRAITKERLERAGYFNISKAYESIHDACVLRTIVHTM